MDERGHREITVGLGKNPRNFRKILDLVTRHDNTNLECFMVVTG